MKWTPITHIGSVATVALWESQRVSLSEAYEAQLIQLKISVCEARKRSCDVMMISNYH